jgi:hypothetical protein
MNERTKRKIARFFVSDLLEFKLKLPVWVILFMLLLPLIAYLDLVWIGKYNFFDYLGICAIEIFLVYLGFSIASSTFKIINKGDK